MAFRITVNLGNSIIGVSILTMPYCFQQCGILLSICLILLSGLLNRGGCHLLFRAAVMSRKRSFELMALEALGPFGKFLVELGVLGFLLGTCVAYFVVIGDLGPEIITDFFAIPNEAHLRILIVTFIAIFVALPLALLRRVESLSSLSALSFGLYLFLALKLFSEASVNVIVSELSSDSEAASSKSLLWWNTSAILPNLPIFAMSLSCQTQLFEVFDHSSLNFDDYDVVGKLNRIVRRAVHLCTVIYISVGLFGYLAFHKQSFGGNILAFLPPSLGSTVAKIGFIATVAVSLPLCLFPCRTSLHSLLVRTSRESSKVSLLNELMASSNVHFMSDKLFRILTVILITLTVAISIVVPHIEFVLSIIGSTIGTMICFILPGLVYLNLTKKDTAERLMARMLTYLGFFILIACTFATLSSSHFDNSLPVASMVSNRVTPQMAVLNEHLERPSQKVKPLSDSGKGGGSGREVSGGSVAAAAAESLQAHLPPPPPASAPPSISSHRQSTSKGKQLLQKAISSQVVVTADPVKIKQELLDRLEKQQQEHRHLIEEQKEVLRQMKRHEENIAAQAAAAAVVIKQGNLSTAPVKERLTQQMAQSSNDSVKVNISNGNVSNLMGRRVTVTGSKSQSQSREQEKRQQTAHLSESKGNMSPNNNSQRVRHSDASDFK